MNAHPETIDAIYTRALAELEAARAALVEAELKYEAASDRLWQARADVYLRGRSGTSEWVKYLAAAGARSAELEASHRDVMERALRSELRVQDEVLRLEAAQATLDAARAAVGVAEKRLLRPALDSYLRLLAEWRKHPEGSGESDGRE